MREKIIYLDNNATTPCSCKVQAAMRMCMAEQWGNTSSQHFIGRQAYRLLEESRERAAGALACRKSEIFFNSGATEGNNWVFLSLLKSNPTRRRIVISSIEHKSVLLSARALKTFGFEVVEMPVTQEGVVDTAKASELISDNTLLVSCQYANNETGVMQPVAQLCEQAHNVGALFHCDAVQGLGKDYFEMSKLDCDVATFSGHKIHGPQGTGILFLRGGFKAWPHLLPFAGGGQEHDVHPGTHNLPGIVGLATAAEEVVSNLSQRIEHFSSLQTLLENELLANIPGCIIHGKTAKRIPNTTNVAIPGLPADILIANMPLFCISNGSACNNGAIGAPYVLLSMGCSEKVSKSSIRISTSIFSVESDVQDFVSELVVMLKTLPTL